MRTSYLLEQQLQLVLSALTPENRLVCLVMLHTGLRISDVVAIPKSSVKPYFSIREQKTGKTRRVGLPAELREAILAAAGSSPWAFPSPRDPAKHRTRQAVWKDIKTAQRAFRMPANAGTHSMRKVYAVELMRKYGDIEKVRRTLGHDYISTTLLYAMADKLMESAELRRKTRP